MAAQHAGSIPCSSQQLTRICRLQDLTTAVELVDSVKGYKVEQLFKLFDTNQDGKIDFKVGPGFLAGLILCPAAWAVLWHRTWYRVLRFRASSCTVGHCQDCV